MSRSDLLPESLIKIGYQVIDMLNPDREPDQVVRHDRVCAFDKNPVFGKALDAAE